MRWFRTIAVWRAAWAASSNPSPTGSSTPGLHSGEETASAKMRGSFPARVRAVCADRALRGASATSDHDGGLGRRCAITSSWM